MDSISGLDNNEPVIATEDRVLYDEAIGIHRKVFAGQRVPPDLVDAYNKAVGSEKPETPKDEPASPKRAAKADSAKS